MRNTYDVLLQTAAFRHSNKSQSTFLSGWESVARVAPSAPRTPFFIQRELIGEVLNIWSVFLSQL